MELLSVIAISLIAAILNSFHVIIQWMANKPGETFTGIAHSFADYFLYVGAMAQGAAGRWIWAEHLFTNEPMKPTWYYWFYVSLGHIGSWMHLSSFATYNVSLIIFVFLLCLTWYHLAITLNPTSKLLRLTSWMIILTTTSFFSLKRSHLLRLDGVELLGQFWFSPSPVFARLGGVPYHALQSIIFVLLAIIFSRLIHQKSITQGSKLSHGNMLSWFFTQLIHRPTSSLVIGNLKLVILAAIAASANPVQMMVFGASAMLTVGRAAQGSWSRRGEVIGLLLAAGGAGAMLSNLEFSRQAVFSAARVWELAQEVSHSLPVLLLSIGPVLLLLPFGLQKVMRERNVLPTVLVIWGLLSFVLFLSPIPRLMGLSPVRFLHPVPYAASLAILGTEGLVVLSALLHQCMKRWVSKESIFAGLLTLYFFLTIPSVSRQFIDRITPARNPQLLMDTMYNHVPAPIVEALSWLKNQNPDVRAYDTPGVEHARTCGICNIVVLTDPAIPIEVLVSVFTGLPSFSGHPIHTLYPDVKEAKRQEFFRGKMNEEETKQFLKDHRIGYIITTTKPSSVFLKSLSFIKEIYQNTTITIYQPANK
ncbi:hypothetical protein HY949_03935 [Candidatus Gottesmanbacteria bacterium]|nr:hypothetical protein [Candidatus Gottesmanbacteria bacterium]